MSAIQYLDELDAKATAWESRVQIACAQAIVEAIQEQTVVLEMLSTSLTLLPAPPQAPLPARPVCPPNRIEHVGFWGITYRDDVPEAHS